ncbi:hypothetical protein M0657_010524 [Pyricularia oryzae]|uniref:Uncharacterized protein n=1 Tax=Pyricularia oryzae TaxID=318829 RepID=A0A4P7NVX4_PYROR|nr:uncharacterized protein PpBr36_11141 [Pyricularia pennisetigena]KAI7909455.1 hypothetical protein M9X92_011625 [Pyricularia oryzae]KAI7912267.1 hypothetical protein M0657_010524 [Pyricularia oryzae]QBZ66747.1 hypothetical protein PoMZ_13734 [Pyricularia oryzae]TLS20506.1 hypothetical protein PpBr36_11141 [Pyricularia pennisetigena]
MASTDPTRALCFIIEENFAQKQMLREKCAIIEALQNQVQELQIGNGLQYQTIRTQHKIIDGYQAADTRDKALQNSRSVESLDLKSNRLGSP